MKHYLYGLLIFFSSELFVTIYAQEQASIESENPTLLIFGDSLSSAYNMPVEKGWVGLLEQFLDKNNYAVDIVNASISGETTSNGLLRLEKHLKQHQPDIILIELGGNDGLRGFSLNTTKENLSQMIQVSLDHNALVLLAGIKIPPNYGKTYTEKFYQLYGELSKKYGVSLIPFLLEKVATKPHYMQADGIHPNVSAQPLIMQTVWQYLEPLLVNSRE